MGEKTLIERLREHVRIFRQAAGFIESGSSVAILFDEAAAALSDRDARIAALEDENRHIREAIQARKAIYQAKAEMEDGLSKASYNRYEAMIHTAEAFEYLEAEIARALLTPTGTEIKDE